MQASPALNLQLQDQTFREVIENQILQSIHFYLTYTETSQIVLILILSVN